MTEILWHDHHIIPKHAGGTDDPSNIIRVNVPMHAFLHEQLYKKYGRLGDKLAWLGLSGRIGKEEIIRILQSENGKKNKGKKKGPMAQETKDKISASHKGKSKFNGKDNPMYGKTGENSPNYGKKWCYDPNTGIEKWVFPEQIPNGYIQGRADKISKTLTNPTSFLNACSKLGYYPITPYKGKKHEVIVHKIATGEHFLCIPDTMVLSFGRRPNYPYTPRRKICI